MRRGFNSSMTWSPGKKQLVAVAVQFFINGAMFASFVPRLPEIRDRIGVGVGGIGLLIATAAAIGVVGSFVAGPVIGAVGGKRTLLVAGTLMAVLLPMIGFAATPAQFVVALGLMFALDVLVDVAMNMHGSAISAQRATPVMNRLHGFWSIGAVAGGLTSSRLAAAEVSISAHLLVVSVLLLVAVVWVSRGLGERPVPVVEPVPMVNTADDSAHGTTRLRPVGGSRLLLFGLAGLFALTMESASIDWAAFRFVDDLGESPGVGAAGFVSVTVGMTVGRFGGDWATLRLGVTRLSLVSNSITIVGLLAALLVGGRYVSLFGYVLVGVGIATMLPRLYDSAAKAGSRRGAGLGALTAGMRIGSLVVPVTIGKLAESGLAVGGAVAVVTLPAAVGFVVVTRILSDAS